MNIFLCDMHVTYIGKASPLMRYTNMSDSFKQLDTVGKLRYKEKLGMLGVTTDPYRLQKMFGRPTKCFLRGMTSTVNHLCYKIERATVAPSRIHV